jgi:hypothetical protein
MKARCSGNVETMKKHIEIAIAISYVLLHRWEIGLQNMNWISLFQHTIQLRTFLVAVMHVRVL